MKLKEDESKISFDEYLQGEEFASMKHEFVDGEVYAMTGASFKHSLINGNIYFALRTHLFKKDCIPLSNDQMVADKEMNTFGYYPDTLVVCGKPEFGDTKERILLNPKVIIEVLSPSTEGVDRGMKTFHYRLIESLSDYLIVSQDIPRVEHFFRKEDEEWGLTTHKGIDATLTLSSVEFSLPLRDLYERVL